MEVAESAAGLLIYKELDYSCIHRGKNLVPFPAVNAQTQGKITYSLNKQMIITLIAVLHIKFAAMSSIMFCIAANTCF